MCTNYTEIVSSNASTFYESISPRFNKQKFFSWLQSRDYRKYEDEVAFIMGYKWGTLDRYLDYTVNMKSIPNPTTWYMVSKYLRKNVVVIKGNKQVMAELPKKFKDIKLKRYKNDVVIKRNHVTGRFSAVPITEKTMKGGNNDGVEGMNIDVNVNDEIDKNPFYMLSDHYYKIVNENTINIDPLQAANADITTFIALMFLDAQHDFKDEVNVEYLLFLVNDIFKNKEVNIQVNQVKQKIFELKNLEPSDNIDNIFKYRPQQESDVMMNLWESFSTRPKICEFNNKEIFEEQSLGKRSRDENEVKKNRGGSNNIIHGSGSELQIQEIVFDAGSTLVSNLQNFYTHVSLPSIMDPGYTYKAGVTSINANLCGNKKSTTDEIFHNVLYNSINSNIIKRKVRVGNNKNLYNYDINNKYILHLFVIEDGIKFKKYTTNLQEVLNIRNDLLFFPGSKNYYNYVVVKKTENNSLSLDYSELDKQLKKVITDENLLMILNENSLEIKKEIDNYKGKLFNDDETDKNLNELKERKFLEYKIKLYIYLVLLHVNKQQYNQIISFNDFKIDEKINSIDIGQTKGYHIYKSPVKIKFTNNAIVAYTGEFISDKQKLEAKLYINNDKKPLSLSNDGNLKSAKLPKNINEDLKKYHMFSKFMGDFGQICMANHLGVPFMSNDIMACTMHLFLNSNTYLSPLITTVNPMRGIRNFLTPRIFSYEGNPKNTNVEYVQYPPETSGEFYNINIIDNNNLCYPEVVKQYSDAASNAGSVIVHGINDTESTADSANTAFQRPAS